MTKKTFATLLFALLIHTGFSQTLESAGTQTEDLDKYLGTYSSKDVRVKITISKKDNTLVAQATGQGAFGVEATEKDKFKNDQAAAKLEFNTIAKTMVVKQDGEAFKFTKE